MMELNELKDLLQIMKKRLSNNIKEEIESGIYWGDIKEKKDDILYQILVLTYELEGIEESVDEILSKQKEL